MTEMIDAIAATDLILPKQPTRAQILDLERAMDASPDAIRDLPVEHTFMPGLYIRTLHIPAGVCLTGKEHKTRHMNVLSKGEIIVWTENGMQHLKAPYSFESQPGTKRVGYAVTDVMWSTFHFTFETDLAKIEAEVIEASPVEQIEAMPLGGLIGGTA